MPPFSSSNPWDGRTVVEMEDVESSSPQDPVLFWRGPRAGEFPGYVYVMKLAILVFLLG